MKWIKSSDRLPDKGKRVFIYPSYCSDTVNDKFVESVGIAGLYRRVTTALCSIQRRCYNVCNCDDNINELKWYADDGIESVDLNDVYFWADLPEGSDLPSISTRQYIHGVHPCYFIDITLCDGIKVIDKYGCMWCGTYYLGEQSIILPCFKKGIIPIGHSFEECTLPKYNYTNMTL